jgi:preprotein translocase subunit SecG
MPALGFITQANAALLGSATVSVGTSLYDGDQLSTAALGIVRIRSRETTLVLLQESGLEFHNLIGPPDGVSVELSRGSLAFFAKATAVLAIRANGALSRPVAGMPTRAQVQVAGSKKLVIFVQQGSLEFTYHDESAKLEEGKGYQVLLDAPETAARNSSAPDSKKVGRSHKTFLITVIAVAAAAIAIPLLLRQQESPYTTGGADHR